MPLLFANLLSCGLFLCLIVGLNLPPCLSSPSNVSCRALTGRVASLGPASLGGEYIAGSVLMYSQFNLTFDGVPGIQSVTGPEELASLDSAQLSGNGVNASLHVTMADGHKCLCGIRGGGVLDCSDFAMPKPPWPAHIGCQWHWAKGGMLMETNASSANHSCLDSATTSVNLPRLFWPYCMTVFYNQSTGGANHLKCCVMLTQKFNGSQWSQQVIDAQIGNKWPIRISHVGHELVTMPDGNQTYARIYRKYFGWSRHCLHECRVVFDHDSHIDTLGRETCKDLKSPFDHPTMAAQITDGCVWAFTATCKPVLVRSDNPSLPCPPPSRLPTVAGPTKGPTENL